MLRSLIRFVFFVLPNFIFYSLDAILFDDFDIFDFRLKGDKRPPKPTQEQIEAEILRKHLLNCYKLVEKNIKAESDGEKKKTD